MPSASPFYESAVVLGAGSVAAGLLAVAATVWAAVYASRPRRALLYRVKSWRPATPAEQVPAVLSPSNQEIVDIQLRGSGRLDIASAAFDSGKPVVASLNGVIVALIGPPVTYPEDRDAPPAMVRAGKLEIGPGLIGRNQILTYRVLASLLPRNPLHRPWLTVRGSLIDVRVQPREPFWVATPWMVSSTVLAPGAFLLIRLGLKYLYAHHFATVVTYPLGVLQAGVVLWMLSAVLTMGYVVIDYVHDYRR